MANVREKVSLRQLSLFVALVKQGSFSRTAEQVGISQPALSIAIRQLEDRLGIRLLDRTSHRVALTEAGEKLLLHAERLLNTADHAFSAMHEIVRGHHASVRVGATPSTMHLMADAIARLNGAGIEAQFLLCDGTAGELLDKLRCGELDIVLGVHFQPSRDLDTTALRQDDLILLVPEAHRLAGFASVTWQQLAGEEIAHFGQGSIAALAAGALQRHALAVSPRYNVDQLASLSALVRANLAIGIISSLYVRDIETDGLRFVPVTEPVVQRNISLFRHRNLHRENPLAAQCYDRLAASLKVD